MAKTKTKKDTATSSNAKKAPAKKAEPKKPKVDHEKRFLGYAYASMILAIIGMISCVIVYLLKNNESQYFTGMIVGLVLGMATITVWSLAFNNRTKSIYALAFVAALAWLVIGLVGMIWSGMWGAVLFAIFGIFYVVIMIVPDVRRGFNL